MHFKFGKSMFLYYGGVEDIREERADPKGKKGPKRFFLGCKSDVLLAG